VKIFAIFAISTHRKFKKVWNRECLYIYKTEKRVFDCLEQKNPRILEPAIVSEKENSQKLQPVKLTRYKVCKLTQSKVELVDCLEVKFHMSWWDRMQTLWYICHYNHDDIENSQTSDNILATNHPDNSVYNFVGDYSRTQNCRDDPD
jgi:hypothetical protein